MLASFPARSLARRAAGGGSLRARIGGVWVGVCGPSGDLPGRFAPFMTTLFVRRDSLLVNE